MTNRVSRWLSWYVAIASAVLTAPAEAQDRPPSAVVVTAAVEESVAPEQSFVGTVMPTRVAAIGSAVDGRVVERPVEEGDRVEVGQKLAQLLTETISLELAAAEAELELRQQRLAELENGSRPEEILQAEAKMLSAQARMKYTAARRKRVENLYSSRSAATEEELEEATATAIEAEQSYRDAKAAHALAIAGPREEVILQARAQVAIQQAVVEKLRDQMRKHTIVSRFTGYVTRENTEIGQWVSKGDLVAEIVAIDEVEVVVQVVERYVTHVQPGAEVRVEIPAISERPSFSGTVMTTVPQGDVRARTFPVKIRVKNEIGPDGPLLKAGMYARAILPVGEPQPAVLVPKDAVVLGGPQPVVIAVAGASEAGQVGTTVTTPVKLGVAKGLKIQVEGDVAAGQLVVIQGNERLLPGQQVVITKIDETVAMGVPSGGSSTGIQ